MFRFKPDERHGFEVAFRRHKDGIYANIVLMLVAPKGGAGKTTLTLASAQALAARGARVLLVDKTEGQAQLTMRFAPETMKDPKHPYYGMGIGDVIYALAGHLHGLGHLSDEDLTRELVPKARKVVQKIKPVLKSLVVDPKTGATLDFVPCGSLLAAVAEMPIMADLGKRKAVFQAALAALAIECGGGWDYIFLDVVPSTTSPIVKGALSVATRAAVVVDCLSSCPLAGLRELYKVASDIKRNSGASEDLIAGWVLNRLPDPRGTKVPLVSKIVRLEIQALVQETDIPVLASVKSLDSLAMLGHNQNAVNTLMGAFPGGIPADPGELNAEQMEAVRAFQANDGADLSVGIRPLIQRSAGSARALFREERELMPMVLSLAGESKAAVEWMDRVSREEV